jgi:hypothetical protein
MNFNVHSKIKHFSIKIVLKILGRFLKNDTTSNYE